MATITQIETQKKNTERCSVYLDGTFYCGLKMEIAVKHHLKAGMEIEKAELDEIQFEEEKTTALDMCMRLIAGSMKTEKQIDEYLDRKGYKGPTCEYVKEKLRYYGLLDDLKYCQAYISSVKGKGRRALMDDLYRRGAKREAIEEALADYTDDEDEAYCVLCRYMRGKEITQESARKGFRYLMTKGFSYETAKACLKRLGEDMAADAGTDVEDNISGPDSDGERNEDN
ncbi:MAG: RecX family transcriptional regulator [Clostridia bacterium]|nr:RecX family transcriptional regulator [Clostridia bacterium]